MEILNDFESHWSDFYFGVEPFKRWPNIEVFINSNLDEEQKITVLTCGQGRTRISINPKIAISLDLDKSQTITDLDSFRTLLSDVGIELHSPDNIYFSDKPSSAISADKNVAIRKLTEEDEALYSKFTNGIDPEELDNAWVE
jgi:hypothetical protein